MGDSQISNPTVTGSNPVGVTNLFNKLGKSCPTDFPLWVTFGVTEETLFLGITPLWVKGAFRMAATGYISSLQFSVPDLQARALV